VAQVKLALPASRRDFMRHVGQLGQVGMGMLFALNAGYSVAKLNGMPYWAGTAKQGRFYWLIIVDAQGQVIRQIKLPSRGHGLQQSAKGQLAVCSRRPGVWILMLQHALAPTQWLKVTLNHPLSGHCCFSSNGELLYSAENNIASGQGCIGIWDGHTGRRLNHWLSQGIGPHEIHLSHDGTHLWVANGGILTQPKHGRKKLNLATMAANISYLCVADGTLINQYSIDEPKLSLRHIAVNSANQVAVACQYQGPSYDRKKLLLLISNDHINYLPCDPQVIVNINNYLGSVAFDISGQWLSASSPRGHRVIVWRLVHGTEPIHYDTLSITDACGLSANNELGGFIISTGMGNLYHYSATTKTLVTMDLGTSTSHHFSWDNHLLPRHIY
tara:strand:- start:215 stop:1372 length:1158 start_codon:yes stop_codon:yes gene_type:complete